MALRSVSNRPSVQPKKSADLKAKNDQPFTKKDDKQDPQQTSEASLPTQPVLSIGSNPIAPTPAFFFQAQTQEEVVDPIAPVISAKTGESEDTINDEKYAELEQLKELKAAGYGDLTVDQAKAILTIKEASFSQTASDQKIAELEQAKEYAAFDTSKEASAEDTLYAQLNGLKGSIERVAVPVVEETPLPSGFINEKNTCFVNAALQGILSSQTAQETLAMPDRDLKALISSNIEYTHTETDVRSPANLAVIKEAYIDLALALKKINTERSEGVAFKPSKYLTAVAQKFAAEPIKSKAWSTYLARGQDDSSDILNEFTLALIPRANQPAQEIALKFELPTGEKVSKLIETHIRPVLGANIKSHKTLSDFLATDTSPIDKYDYTDDKGITKRITDYKHRHMSTL